MLMKQLFWTWSILLALCIGASGRIHAQNIAEIAKSDPLIVTGSVGTQNTYRYSSLGNGYGSPFSSSIYANLNISLYGFNMPFSLYYTSDNYNFSYPHLTFNLTPTYKHWTGHLGLSSMTMSSYVMNTSFYGVGVEYQSDRLRAGLFYGRFREAINDNPDDPFARSPQYKRVGWGMKVGYGTQRNFLDLYFLKAYDRPSSLNEAWRAQLPPQENLAVALKGCLTLSRYLSLTANVAMSLINTDMEATKIHSAETDNTLWGNVFDVRYSTLARFAGDATLNLRMGGVSASLVYRMVQPDYTSMGVSYMSNNYQSMGLHLSTHLLKVVSLTGNCSLQQDNLTNRQLYTTRGVVYSLSANTRLGSHFNLNAACNGYTQKQYDGTARVNDSTRVNRCMQSFTLTPSAHFDSQRLGHAASLSLCLSSNKDLNPYATGISDVTTIALGSCYSLTVKPWAMTFTLSLNHQQSKGYQTRYSSDIASLTTSRSFLQDHNLNLSATLSLCRNEVQRQSKNLSIGGDLQAGYTLHRDHVFSASASFYKYGDVNITKTRSNLDCTDVTLSLNYAYTFSLFEIHSKKKNL